MHSNGRQACWQGRLKGACQLRACSTPASRHSCLDEQEGARNQAARSGSQQVGARDELRRAPGVLLGVGHKRGDACSFWAGGRAGEQAGRMSTGCQQRAEHRALPTRIECGPRRMVPRLHGSAKAALVNCFLLPQSPPIPNPPNLPHSNRQELWQATEKPSPPHCCRARIRSMLPAGPACSWAHELMAS